MPGALGLGPTESFTMSMTTTPWLWFSKSTGGESLRIGCRGALWVDHVVCELRDVWIAGPSW